MIKLALLPILLGLANARPQAATGGIQCSGPLHWINGGVTMDVAVGTNCVMVGGVATFPEVNGLVAVESPSIGNPAEASQSSAAAVAAGTATGAAPGVTSAAVAPQNGAQLVLKPLTAKWPAGNAPGKEATAACPANGATVTASVPAPLTSSSNKDGKRYIAYWSASHGTGEGNLPAAQQLEGVTHLILAFWEPRNPLLNGFTSASSTNTEWGINIAQELRTQANNPNLKVMVAMGGWDLDEFFRHNATDLYRDDLAQLFADFVNMYQLDGVDVDWEYPVTNGGSYKTSRPESLCDKDNNVLLMQSIRNKLEALKSDSNPIKEYVLSLAVPAGALHGDMAAYNQASVTEIDKVVDFWNVMSYDAVNRRSKIASHHGGGGVIKDTLKRYKDLGLPKEKLNIGFAMYAKVFSMTKATGSDCSPSHSFGCNMGDDTFEYPTNGSDKGASGAILFRPDLNSALALGTDSFNTMSVTLQAYAGWDRVKTGGIRDDTALATYDYDESTNNFYTWLTGKDMYDSCVRELPGAGGIMVWSLDQDNLGAEGGEHFAGLLSCLKGE